MLFRSAGLAARVPATLSLEIEVDGPVDVDALAALPGVVRPHQEATLVRAGVGDLGRDAPALLQALVAQGRRVTRVGSGRAGLEDVFLALTGRALRD